VYAIFLRVSFPYENKNIAVY